MARSAEDWGAGQGRDDMSSQFPGELPDDEENALPAGDFHFVFFASKELKDQLMLPQVRSFLQAFQVRVFVYPKGSSAYTSNEQDAQAEARRGETQFLVVLDYPNIGIHHSREAALASLL